MDEAAQAFDLLLQLLQEQATGSRKSCLLTIFVFAVCERPLLAERIKVLLSLRCASYEVFQSGLLLRSIFGLSTSGRVSQQLALQRRKANVVVSQLVHHSLRSPDGHEMVIDCADN